MPTWNIKLIRDEELSLETFTLIESVAARWIGRRAVTSAEKALSATRALARPSMDRKASFLRRDIASDPKKLKERRLKAARAIALLQANEQLSKTVHPLKKFDAKV